MIPTPQAISRIKRLGVVVSAQPGAIRSGGDSYIATWGPERVQRLMPLRSFLDAGIRLALGSDFPTVPHLAPQLGMYEAITRRTSSGRIIAPQEGITIQEALRAHTMGSAYAGFEEGVKGSIEVGKYADMVVWSGDLYTVPAEKIQNLRTIVTVVGGTVVTMIGDIDGNRSVNVEDFVSTVNMILNRITPTEVQRRAADINADDSVDVRDLAGLTLMILGGS